MHLSGPSLLMETNACLRNNTVAEFEDPDTDGRSMSNNRFNRCPTENTPKIMQEASAKTDFEDRRTRRQKRRTSAYPAEFTGPLSTRRLKSLHSTKRTPSEDSLDDNTMRRRSSVEFRKALGVDTWFKRDKLEDTVLTQAYAMGLTTNVKSNSEHFAMS